MLISLLPALIVPIHMQPYISLYPVCTIPKSSSYNLHLELCYVSGFENGHIQYDDHSPPNTRGDHPDGEFTTDTLIEFCCRSDGNKDIPIELPTGQKFILWKKNKNGCQKVKGTVKSVLLTTCIKRLPVLQVCDPLMRPLKGHMRQV